MTVYSLTWLGVFVLVSIAVSLIAALTGSVELVATLMYPAAMVLAAMFFTSLYFTFRDNFSTIVEATP
jgi:divalent metal cation (Fe/Co/Zn/Cd) transporter